MADKCKRAEFVVEAESTGGIERGLNLANRKIEAGVLSGRESLPRHGISVEWRILDVVRATDVGEGSLLMQDPPPPAQNIPDVSTMDIEEAKGIVATASNLEELDIIEQLERAGTRVPGGRKGVLNFLEKRRVEIKSRAERKAAETSEDPGKEV